MYVYYVSMSNGVLIDVSVNAGLLKSPWHPNCYDPAQSSLLEASIVCPTTCIWRPAIAH